MIYATEDRSGKNRHGDDDGDDSLLVVELFPSTHLIRTLLVVGFLNFPDSINFQFHLKNLIK